MKGIIVLDKIPQTCQHIRGNEEDGCPFGGMSCQICDTDVMKHTIHGTKPDWCPIKPIPERKMCTKSICIVEDEYNQRKGWNDCLNEVLGIDK